jgi:ABC-type transport system substrate-binding protein
MGVRRRVGAVLLASTLAAVAACSSSSSPGATASSGPQGKGTTVTTAGKPKRGGTLRVGILRPHTLDPVDASPTAQGEMLAVDLLFDSLTEMGPGAATASPSVAAQWTATPDLRAWRFTLAHRTFANGRAIVAADVKYSLERVAKKGRASLAAARLDTITGWAAFTGGTAPELAGIKAVDPAIVEIDLDAPLSTLPELLSSPLYGIVPKEAVEAANPPFAAAPVGSGPFRFASAAGDVVHLARAGGSEAFLDGIDLSLYDTLDAGYAAFTDGKLDWSLVPTAQTQAAAGRYGRSGYAPFGAELFFAFNVVNPAFADSRFRQAMLQAVDRDALVKAVYPDRGEVLTGVVPDGVPGHAADPCGPPCAYDVAAAKALLAQVFPPPATPPAVQIDYYQGTDTEAAASAIATDLQAVGIPAAKRPHTFDEYQTFATSGQEQLFLFGWAGVYQAPDAYLDPLFAGGSADNVTGLNDPAINQLLATARSTLDPTARAAANRQAEAAITTAAAVIPVVQFLTTSVVAKRVRDLVLQVDGTFAGEKVWLAG